MDNLTVGSDLYKRILHRANGLEGCTTRTERKLLGILKARLEAAELAHEQAQRQAHSIAHLADAADWCAVKECGSLGTVEF